jgi:hypothetical protein
MDAFNKIATPLLALTIFVIIIGVILHFVSSLKEGFEDSSFKSNPLYKTQIQLLSDTYSGTASGRQPLANGFGDMPESEQILTNFFSLGCRFTGFIGPANDFFYDPDIAVQAAVNAGCRTFVLEIDYLDSCTGDRKYFPTLAVRDKNGRLFTNASSIKSACNSLQYSTIRDTCKSIATYAYADSCQNKSDPVIIVLYFIRQPPGPPNSEEVLTYFSRVAQMLEPLKDRFLGNEINGTYYRQKQESLLLMNKISFYNNKVLIFNNAYTGGFRDSQIDKKYKPDQDLDFITNLRLSYTQTQLGVTDNTQGATFGQLETVDAYLTIPKDRTSTAVQQTKQKWTMCFAKDPFESVTVDIYNKVTTTYGVHCIPIIIHDIPANQYMFKNGPFAKYSFIPKPKELRMTKPPVIIAASPSQETNANGGSLTELTTPGA